MEFIAIRPHIWANALFQALEATMGLEGYGVYLKLVDLLYTSEDLTYPCDYDLVARVIREDADKVRKVVEEYDLFKFDTIDGKRIFWEPFSRNKVISRKNAGRKGGKRKSENRQSRDDVG